MDKMTIIKLAAQAGFGANQRNTLLVKLMMFAALIEVHLKEKNDDHIQ